MKDEGEHFNANPLPEFHILIVWIVAGSLYHQQRDFNGENWSPFYGRGIKLNKVVGYRSDDSRLYEKATLRTVENLKGEICSALGK